MFPDELRERDLVPEPRHPSDFAATVWGIVSVIGIPLMLVAFLLSIVAFAIIASLVLLVVIYVLWVTRRARRAMRDQVIEGEVKSRDIH